MDKWFDCLSTLVTPNKNQTTMPNNNTSDGTSPAEETANNILSSSSANTTTGVFRVGIRVPPFWPEEPAVWFAQLESQFNLSGITSDTTKFYHVIGKLDPQYATEVKDKTGKIAAASMCQPRQSASYTVLLCLQYRTAPIATSWHSGPNRTFYIPKDLKDSEYVFLRQGPERRSLEAPYQGPFKVLRRGSKSFDIEVKGRMVTVTYIFEDRLPGRDRSLAIRLLADLPLPM